MGSSIKSTMLMAVVAVVALCACTGARAFASVHISIAAPEPLYPPAVQSVHLPVHEEYGSPAACGAPRWHPRVRYMPGQVVQRHGGIWVARGISARVWNENSPPEWTPRYWAPAVCG